MGIIRDYLASYDRGTSNAYRIYGTVAAATATTYAMYAGITASGAASGTAYGTSLAAGVLVSTMGPVIIDKAEQLIKRYRTDSVVKEFITEHPAYKGQETELAKLHKELLSKAPEKEGLRTFMEAEKESRNGKFKGNSLQNLRYASAFITTVKSKEYSEVRTTRKIEELNEEYEKRQNKKLKENNSQSKKGFQPQTTTELKVLCNDETIKLDEIDISKITDMKGIFENSKRKDFNGLETWDVSHVKSMENMFKNAQYFNHPIETWNTSNVEDMTGMFCNTPLFNQPLEKWDVSNVKSMSIMFMGAKAFNQPLNNWDVSNVTDISGIFSETEVFDQPLDKWDVSNVREMTCAFYEAKEFNQAIKDWNTSKTKEMFGMFKKSEKFNQPINNWDITNVEDMREMFNNAKSFNQVLPEEWATKARYDNPKNHEIPIEFDPSCKELFEKRNKSKENSNSNQK